MPYNLSIPGQVSEFQLRAIECVAALVPPGGHVIEVGSLFGCSSWAWARSVDPSVTVHCIDPWEKNEGVRPMEARYGVAYGIEQFRAFTADCPNIVAHQGYSPMQFLDWALPVDLYYEDAVHTNPILAQNLDFWSARLAPAGILCGDDFRPRFPDVRSGVHQLAGRFSRALITVDFFWCLLPDPAVLPAAAAVAARLQELSAESDAARRARGFLMSAGPRQPIGPVRRGSSPVLACRLSNEGLDPGPPGRPGPLSAGVRLVSTGATPAVVAEARVPLGLDLLPPDLPRDFDLVLPAGALAPGSYKAVFGLVDGAGAWVHPPDAEAAAGSLLEVVRQLPQERRPLLDAEVVRADFAAAAFADSHGAFGRHLGAGALYYALGHAVRSQVSVCIGSGGGFVPSLMRRAQLDAGIAPAATWLVDANLPELAFGSPGQPGGWMTGESAFLKRERDILVLPMLSVDAARLLAREAIRIDHLHIDGDHSARGVMADFAAFAPLLSAHGVVTLHDLRMPGVDQALGEIARRFPEFELLSLRDLGAGTGIMRRRLPADTPRRPQTTADFVEAGRKVRPDPSPPANEVAASQARSRFERWAYLKTPGFATRYTLAAALIDGPGRVVVEIGGFPSSIAGHLRHSRRLHLIEPYAPAEYCAEVEAAAQQIEVLIHHGDLASVASAAPFARPYALVALGLDLTTGAVDAAALRTGLERFVELCAAAERVAVEVPGHHLSQLTWTHLSTIVAGEVLADITLDLSRDPEADRFHVKDARAQRRLIGFRPKPALAPTTAEVQALITLAARELEVARTAEAAPAEATYRLGERIDFAADGQSARFTRTGWVMQEARHRWMQSTESWLVLAIPAADLAAVVGQTVRLRGRLRPLVHDEHLPTQTLAISVNGIEVHEARHAAPFDLDVSFAAALLEIESPVRIGLFHPDAARPIDLFPASRDLKSLSFAVEWLSLG